jgi:hypothetical protein
MAQPNKSQFHRDQAIHNRLLVDTDTFPPTDPESSFRDWSTTISFYAALHYIQSYFERQSLRTTFRDHGDRNNYIKTNNDPLIQAISVDYITLYNASIKTRYNPLFFNSLTIEDVKKYYDLAFLNIPTQLGLL